MVDRPIVYPGSLPLDTDLLALAQNMMIDVGWLKQMVLGTGTYVVGLGVTQTTVASFSVLVGAGAITSLTTLEATAYGSIGSDTTDNLMKMGINFAPTTVGPFTAPGTAGQSVNILIQAAFSEADGIPVVLNYYNASNPAAPYAGPANAGTTNNTRRRQTVTITSIVGTAAATGSQVTPTPTATPLAVVTIANGAANIVNGNISVYPSVPTLLRTLPNAGGAPAGFITPAAGSWTAPAGVYSIRARVWGAGGGGGGTTGAASGGGGGGGGEYREGVFTVTPGTVYTITKGTGGGGGAAGGANTGTAGGSSGISTLVTANGGSGGLGANAALVAGGAGGTGGSGGTFVMSGVGGGAAIPLSGSTGSGSGGAAFGSPGANLAAGAGATAGLTGALPGAGGSGGVIGGAGGAGAAGLVIIEY